MGLLNKSPVSNAAVLAVIWLIEQLSIDLRLIVMIPFVIILGVVSLLALDFKPEYWQSNNCYQIQVITRVIAVTFQSISAFLHSYATLIDFNIVIQLVIAIQITKTMLLAG